MVAALGVSSPRRGPGAGHRVARASAAGFGSRLGGIVEAGLYLPSPFRDLLLEHSDETASLIEFGAHTFEFSLQAI
jgi:hypothetical protein